VSPTGPISDRQFRDHQQLTLANGRFQDDPSAVAEIAAHQIPQSRPAQASALKPQSAMLRT
jgi:hypothetical protein